MVDKATPLPLRPLRDQDDAERLFRELYGDDFESDRIVGFVFGVDGDRRNIGVALRRADGGLVRLSFSAGLALEFAICHAGAWQACIAALAGEPKGKV